MVNKIHFGPKMQWMTCTMLHFVRSISLDVWRIERYVCFWSLWFSKPTISSTVFTFSSVCVCFSSVCWSHAFGRCCMFPKSLLITIPLFLCCSLSSQILPVFSKNCIFELVQVLNQSLVSTAKWHFTSPVYRQCIKNYYLWQYHLLLFANIRNACKTK